MCSGAVHNFAELVICRCFLGVFEAAFGAGAPYFLSLFYQREELGFRVSLLLGMSPIANCFASALAYGITQINHSIASWRYLFIIGMSIALSDVEYTLTSHRGSSNGSIFYCRLLFPPRFAGNSQVSHRKRANPGRGASSNRGQYCQIYFGMEPNISWCH